MGSSTLITKEIFSCINLISLIIFDDCGHFNFMYLPIENTVHLIFLQKCFKPNQLKS